MNFLEDIFSNVEAAGDACVLQREGGRGTAQSSGNELARLIGRGRAFLASRGLNKGDRVALLANNSIRWVAMDLAIMAEGLIAVPLYSRQATEELVKMMQDCSPSLLICGDPALRDAVTAIWPDVPDVVLFDHAFPGRTSVDNTVHVAESDPVAIIYTSGTSGEAKGVVLTAGNVGHMLRCTCSRLDALMRNRRVPDRVFHYLPFCFAASWLMLLSCLKRRSRLVLNTDLNRLANEMRHAEPDYFLNVPALLERMRKGVDEQLWRSGGFPLNVYRRAKGAFVRKFEGKPEAGDKMKLALARMLIFPAIRKKMIGKHLKALICGSAPLTPETQLFFMMIGIPVLQGYGLTETTGICTLDDPDHVEPGRVGPAVSGVEMKVGENEEILVRGPNIFKEYWNRPEETAKAKRDGWFHTGDQGEVNAAGNWRIAGRIKNLIILSSGHNVAPEPIEDKILQGLSRAQQVVLVGNGRGYLSAIITGDVKHSKAQRVLDEINATMPHYKQVRAFHVHLESFSVDNGLLTANGKLKRDAIAQHFSREIEEMNRVKQAV